MRWRTTKRLAAANPTRSCSCFPVLVVVWISSTQWISYASGWSCLLCVGRQRPSIHTLYNPSMWRRDGFKTATSTLCSFSTVLGGTAAMKSEDSIRATPPSNPSKPATTSPVEKVSQEPHEETKLAFDRAKEVGMILVGQMALTLLQSLWKMGRIPTTSEDWETFWAQPCGKRNTISSDGSAVDKEETNAQRICVALEQLGPTFVKFGQAMATRPDIIPTTLANALLRLQDRMEPFDTATAKFIIRQELLQSSSSPLSPTQIESFLSTLSPQPVAAASIGQVYSGFLCENQTLSDRHHHQHHHQSIARSKRSKQTKASLNTEMKVAVKVKRPGIRDTVLRDAAFLKMGARWIDQLSSPFASSSSTGSSSSSAVIATRLENAVDEFMTRIFEELDYRQEANNMQTFARLYSHRRPEQQQDDRSASNIQVVVPELVPELCTEEILVMEWINGTKFEAVDVLPDILDDVDKVAVLTPTERKELVQRQEEVAATIEQDLKLVHMGIQCTLSQLIETGILHADPHTGNLLKVPVPDYTGTVKRRGRAATSTTSKSGNDDAGMENLMLGYLDFGMLATIPETVRDALICSVSQLVFARNIDAMARLFIDLQLLPPHRALLMEQDPAERAVFTAALNETLTNVLEFPNSTADPNDAVGGDGISSSAASSVVPILRFDNLLGALTGLVATFEFQLPPYFLNNARALATLEGVARRLDPSFNVLQIMYPFALNRLLNNPSKSPVVDETLMSLLRSPETDAIEMERIQKLLDDSALLTGYSRRRVLQDVVASKGGLRMIRKVARELLVSRVKRRRRREDSFMSKRRIFRL